MTLDELRTKWGLPVDYPLPTPNYAKIHSDLSPRLGLGRRSTT